MYGDPLEVVGAIKASWYGTHHGEVYTKAVEDELELTDEQKKWLRFTRHLIVFFGCLKRV